MLALKINAKFEGKLTCAFKDDMRSLAKFYRLKNCDFILENKMAKLKNQIDQMQCENFILPCKEMNSTINFRQKRCSLGIRKFPRKLSS